MKGLFTVLTFITFTCLGYLADKKIVHFILKRVPDTEWYGIIEIIVWAIVVLLTASIIFWVATLFSLLVSLFFGDKE